MVFPKTACRSVLILQGEESDNLRIGETNLTTQGNAILLCIFKHETPINAVRGFIVKSAFRVLTHASTVDIAVGESNGYAFP